MIAVVTGMPGVGKTTVLNKALEKLDSYEVVNFGDEMLKHAVERNLVKNRDEIRKLSLELQKEIQRTAAKNIAERGKEKNIIVDTHCTIKTPRGYLPGLPKWVLEELQPEIIVIVDADAGEIASRRAGDETRERDAESIDEIKEQQMMNMCMAAGYAVLTGATVAFVENREGELEKAAEKLAALLR